MPSAYAGEAPPQQSLTSAATHVTKTHANGQRVLAQYYLGYTDQLTVRKAHANNGKKATETDTYLYAPTDGTVVRRAIDVHQSVPDKKPLTHAKPTASEQIGITTISSIITFWQKNKHLTMRDLKSILPRGTTIDHPDWYEGDQAVGNASSIQGPVTGNIVFLSAKQRMKINKGTELSQSEEVYKPTDSADMVQIELASKANGKHIVALLTSALGAKPSNTGFVSPDSEDASMVHGVTADWKLAGGVDVTYDDWRYGKNDVVVVSFDWR